MSKAIPTRPKPSNRRAARFSGCARKATEPARNAATGGRNQARAVGEKSPTRGAMTRQRHASGAPAVHNRPWVSRRDGKLASTIPFFTSAAALSRGLTAVAGVWSATGEPAPGHRQI